MSEAPAATATAATARLRAQRTRNLVLAASLVGFAVLIALITGVRLSEATHREAARRAAEGATGQGTVRAAPAPSAEPNPEAPRT